MNHLKLDPRPSTPETGRTALMQTLATIFLRLMTALGRLPALALLALVRCYQLSISPLLGPRCRFHPSCSEYFLHSVRKHGAMRGSLRGVARICRCHPFHPGGYDPP